MFREIAWHSWCLEHLLWGYYAALFSSHRWCLLLCRLLRLAKGSTHTKMFWNLNMVASTLYMPRHCSQFASANWCKPVNQGAEQAWYTCNKYWPPSLSSVLSLVEIHGLVLCALAIWTAVHRSGVVCGEKQAGSAFSDCRGKTTMLGEVPSRYFQKVAHFILWAKL